MNAEISAGFRLLFLTPKLIPLLEALEEAAGLPFWGSDNYQRFLEEFPEYFGFCLIPEANEKRLAGFSLARATFEELELMKIGVAPEFQRVGLGTRLLNETFAEGKRRRCERCFLEVRKSNHSAIQFYLTHGFQSVGERINYYLNPVEDAWIMENAMAGATF